MMTRAHLARVLFGGPGGRYGLQITLRALDDVNPSYLNFSLSEEISHYPLCFYIYLTSTKVANPT